MVFNPLSLYTAVVEYYEGVVCGHVDVELAAPETCFLGTSQCCNRVLCIAGFFAVPEASVGDDAHLVPAYAAFRRRCHVGWVQHQDAEQRNHGFKMYLHVNNPVSH